MVHIDIWCQLSFNYYSFPLTDNNECEMESVCGSGTFCENTPGSYSCKGMLRMHNGLTHTHTHTHTHSLRQVMHGM